MNKPLPRHNTSGTKGVHFDTRRQKWIAKIQQNYHRKHLGQFDCKLDAVKARAAVEMDSEVTG